MNVEYIEISKIKPAPYNPRVINELQLSNLRYSIAKNGLIIPVIVNKDNMIIVAGHQRTKAAIECGIKETPVLFVCNVSRDDEIKFNQLHNGTESVAAGNIDTTILPEGFQEVDCKKVQIQKSHAPYVKEICKLLLKYGNVLSCVSQNGRIIYGGNYVKAAQLLNLPVNLYNIRNTDEHLQETLNADYGSYSYEKVSRETYVQGLAQLVRSADATDKKAQHSMLYEKMVVPYLRGKKMRFLDFGAGKCAYARKYGGTPLEFYPNNGFGINATLGNKMIDSVVDEITQNGLFEFVVCDSVLNSVDSLQAECSVLDCCNVFTSEKLFVSGRTLESCINKLGMRRDINVGKRFVEFLDKDNFSAVSRRGHWYFQHWHSKETIEQALNNSGFEIRKMFYGKNGDSFQIEAVKVEELPRNRILDAVSFEFNLPLPSGSYNRQNDVITALEKVGVLDGTAAKRN